MKRVFLIVLDSFGIGEMEDAASYGDVNVNTLRSVSSSPFFHVPHLRELGLFDIEGVTVGEPMGEGRHKAAIARLKEASKGHYHRSLGDCGSILTQTAAHLSGGVPGGSAGAFSAADGQRGIV